MQSADKFENLLVSQSLNSIESQAFVAGFGGGGALDESIRKVTKLRSTILVCDTDSEKELNSIITLLGKESLDDVLASADKSTAENRITGVVSGLNKQIQD